MVNSGAIATSSPVPGSTGQARWRFIQDGLSRFASRKLSLNEDAFTSAARTNFRNQEIAQLLQTYGRIYLDPADATDLYTRQCSLILAGMNMRADLWGLVWPDGSVSISICRKSLSSAVAAGNAG